MEELNFGVDIRFVPRTAHVTRELEKLVAGGLMYSVVSTQSEEKSQD